MHRSRDHKMIAGVCGGIAESWRCPPTLVRALFVISCVLPGPQFIIYLLMWLFVPKEPARSSAGRW